MKTKSYTGNDARRVLIGMATDEKVIAAIASKWPQHGGLFASRWENMVGWWCVKHFREFGQPIGRAIEPVFEQWAEKRTDEETIRLAERFLNALSDEYDREEPLDADFLLKTAEQHFDQVRMKQVMEEAVNHLELGQVEDAAGKLASYESFRFDGIVRSASEIPIVPVRWMWNAWLAVGEMAIIDGDPGVGKSQLALDIAGRVTRGHKMPPEPRGTPRVNPKPRNVMILTAEDTWAHTILPRLTVVDADLARIIHLDTEELTFPKDIPLVERQCRERRVRLLIIDPIMAFIGTADENSQAQVRTVLSRLRSMAEKVGLAVILIRHFKKGRDSAIHRGGGSVAWTASCRFQHVVGRAPGQAGLFVLANAKNNLAERPKALSFELEGVSVGTSIPGRRVETSRVRWIGEMDVQADDIADPPKKKGRPSKVAEAAKLIRSILSVHQCMDVDELFRMVTKELNISWDTFKKARKLAGVKTKKHPGQAGKWFVYLPDDEQDEDDDDSDECVPQK